MNHKKYTYLYYIMEKGISAMRYIASNLGAIYSERFHYLIFHSLIYARVTIGKQKVGVGRPQKL